MSKRMQKAEGRKQNHPDPDCGLRNGENREAEIRDKRLGCRGLRQLRWDREIRQILESQGEVTARQEPPPPRKGPLLPRSLATPVLPSSSEGGEGVKPPLT